MLDPEHEALVTGVLEDLTTLFKRFKVIPNASRTYLTGRSQPPLLPALYLMYIEAYNPGAKLA